MTDYSMFGESTIVARHCGKTMAGFCVEIGALDGKHNSNTRMFYEKWNWTGAMYEPNPSSFARLVKNMVGLQCHVHNEAVGASRGIARMKIHRDPGRSHLSDAGDVKVKVVSIAQVIDRAGPLRVNLLSIDAEGMDTEIVEAMCLLDRRILPQYVIVEANTCDALEAQFRAMLGAGYILIGMTGKQAHGHPKANTIWRLRRL